MNFQTARVHWWEPVLLLYISICEIHIIFKKERKLWSSLFQDFGLSGYAEIEIYAFWFQKWPKDGHSYDNATKMFNIKSLSYQRINCETFFKLWSEKCKILCYINHYILVTMATKRTPHRHRAFTSWINNGEETSGQDSQVTEPKRRSGSTSSGKGTLV